MRRLAATLVALGGISVACGNTKFPPEEIVEKDRPLAGHAVVTMPLDPKSKDDFAHRVTPAPGEAGKYEFLVASPGAQVPWSYAFMVCLADYNNSDVAQCRPNTAPVGMAYASLDDEDVAMPPKSLPSVPFVVPKDSELDKEQDELLVVGVLCPNSEPRNELLSALAAGELDKLQDYPNPCDKSRGDDPPGLFISSPFRIQREPNDENHMPVISQLAYTEQAKKDGPFALDQPWPDTAVAQATEKSKGCHSNQAIPQVHTADRYFGLQMTLSADSAETYDKPSLVPGDGPKRTTEVPYVTALASAGKFKILRDNLRKKDQVLQLTWRPPQKPDATGTLVRFWFLAMDDRDAAAQATFWTERALCIVP